MTPLCDCDHRKGACRSANDERLGNWELHLWTAAALAAALGSCVFRFAEEKRQLGLPQSKVRSLGGDLLNHSGSVELRTSGLRFEQQTLETPEPQTSRPKPLCLTKFTTKHTTKGIGVIATSRTLKSLPLTAVRNLFQNHASAPDRSMRWAFIIVRETASSPSAQAS